MNLTNLMLWSASIIIAFAGIGDLDFIQRTMLRAQARIAFESRTETWGSPKIFRILSTPGYKVREHKRSRPKSQ